MASTGHMFFAPFIADPNRVRRNLLLGASNQVHRSSLTLYVLLKAAVRMSKLRVEKSLGQITGGLETLIETIDHIRI